MTDERMIPEEENMFLTKEDQEFLNALDEETREKELKKKYDEFRKACFGI